jgi:fatty acid desaturase
MKTSVSKFWQVAGRNGFGKTYFAIYIVACICNTQPGWGGTIWFVMLSWLACLIQCQVTKCLRRSPLQDWFDEVNEARAQRQLREHIGSRLLLTRGDFWTREAADRAAEFTVTLLDFTGIKAKLA